MDDNDRLADELLAASSSQSPSVLATAWLTTILLQRDLDTAWPFTTAEYRAEIAGSWMDANRSHESLVGIDPDALKEVLASLQHEHELWEPFAEITAGELKGWFPDFDLERWGTASKPRPIGVATELVLFVRNDDPGLTTRAVEVDGLDEPILVKVASDLEMLTYGVIVEHDEQFGWRVSGLWDGPDE